MTDSNERNDTPASGRKPLTLSRTTSSGTVKQSFSHGRVKSVVVETKQRRGASAPTPGSAPPPQAAVPATGGPRPIPANVARPVSSAPPAPRPGSQAPIRPGALSDDEQRRRNEAVARAQADDLDRRERAKADEEQRAALEDAQRKHHEEEQALLAQQEDARRLREGHVAPSPAEVPAPVPEAPAAEGADDDAQPPVAATGQPGPRAVEEARPDERESLLAELGGRVKAARRPVPIAPVKPAKKGEPQRRVGGRLTLDMVERITEGDDEKVRSLAAMRRAREKERERRSHGAGGAAAEATKRDVIIPEAITIQELSNRMAVRAADIIKYLMRQGTMATMNDVLDTDTAELIATDFGHIVRRVAESDVEEGLEGLIDEDEEKEPRPPVVTVMGHVDHGKTSLLDALRSADVASGEAGGITQHIGAYQVRLPTGERVTFLDTPGHAAFSSMRARGAQVTDIVVLVVAADDGVMPQTIEAISHAKAAGVPLIVAVNKMDKHEADPQKVLNELLQYEVITEAVGGDTQAVQVSALKKTGLKELVAAIVVQSEVLDLRANPNRPAEAAVVEAKLDRGRGPVATVLIKRGTLKRGDIVVAGAQWGRVRALLNERNQQVQSAGPSDPVEIMGLEGVPDPGDVLQVVESETRAREITDYRQRKRRNGLAGVLTPARTSLETMMARLKDESSKELALVLKADVQGSNEAITQSLEKLSTEEVRARVIHSGVGAINESDVMLAKASGAPLIGFNVRASKEARDLAERENVEIRYYAIIYEVIDDVKAVMSGMLSPIIRETFLGNAEVLEVFAITRVGKVAGCRVTEGVVRRGARVRILRDNVVIQEMGTLQTLKRFKDEVPEVLSGQECGMSFANFQDIKQGDYIECFNVETVQRTL